MTSLDMFATRFGQEMVGDETDEGRNDQIPFST